MVNEQIIRGRWTELRGKVKERWGVLTDDDLVLAQGNADQLVGIIERRTGESREQIERDLDRLTDDLSSQMEDVRHRAAAAAASASEAVKQYGDRASESAREYADRAGEAARQQYEQLQAQYGQVAAAAQARLADAEQAVRRNPIESLCVAFGTGLIAGVVVGLCFRPSRD